eukprot:2880580-Prymnesium_polylepis.1
MCIRDRGSAARLALREATRTSETTINRASSRHTLERLAQLDESPLMKKEHDGAAPRLSGTESDAKHSSSASGQGSPVKVDGAECSAHSEDSSAPQDPGRAMLEQVLGAVQALGDRLEAVETALQLNPGGAAVTG